MNRRARAAHFGQAYRERQQTASVRAYWAALHRRGWWASPRRQQQTMIALDRMLSLP